MKTVVTIHFEIIKSLNGTCLFNKITQNHLTYLQQWSHGTGFLRLFIYSFYSFIESHTIENIAFVLEHQKEVYNQLEERLQNKHGNVANQLLMQLHAGELVKVREVLSKEALVSTSKDGYKYLRRCIDRGVKFQLVGGFFFIPFGNKRQQLDGV